MAPRASRAVPAQPPRLRRILRPALLERHVAAPPGGEARHPIPPLPLIENGRVIDPDVTRRGPAQTHHAVHRSAPSPSSTATRTSPFFLYLAHSMPHVPLYVSEKFEGKSGAGALRRRDHGDRLVGRRSAGRARPARPGATTRWSFSPPTTARGSATATTPAAPDRSARARAPPGKAACACRASCAGPASFPPGSVSDRFLMTIDLLPTAGAARRRGAPRSADRRPRRLAAAHQPARRHQSARRLRPLVRHQRTAGGRQRRRPMEADAAAPLPHARRTPGRQRRHRRSDTRLSNSKPPPSTTSRPTRPRPPTAPRSIPRSWRVCSPSPKNARADLGDTLSQRPTGIGTRKSGVSKTVESTR